MVATTTTALAATSSSSPSPWTAASTTTTNNTCSTPKDQESSHYKQPNEDTTEVDVASHSNPLAGIASGIGAIKSQTLHSHSAKTDISTADADSSITRDWALDQSLSHPRLQQSQQHKQPLQQQTALPSDLRHILMEVARTGNCAALPWSNLGANEFNLNRAGLSKNDFIASTSLPAETTRHHHNLMRNTTSPLASPLSPTSPSPPTSPPSHRYSSKRKRKNGMNGSLGELRSEGTHSVNYSNSGTKVSASDGGKPCFTDTHSGAGSQHIRSRYFQGQSNASNSSSGRKRPLHQTMKGVSLSPVYSGVSAATYNIDDDLGIDTKDTDDTESLPYEIAGAGRASVGIADDYAKTDVNKDVGKKDITMLRSDNFQPPSSADLSNGFHARDGIDSSDAIFTLDEANLSFVCQNGAKNKTPGENSVAGLSPSYIDGGADNYINHSVAGIDRVSASTTTNNTYPSLYRTLREAVKLAVVLVLDYAYKNQGGYKMNPAEREKRRRRFEAWERDQNQKELVGIVAKRVSQADNGRRENSGSGAKGIPTPAHSESAYRERRARLLAMLDASSSNFVSRGNTEGADESIRVKGALKKNSKHAPNLSSEKMRNANENSGGSSGRFRETLSDLDVDIDGGDAPPFTIQRMAEVLLSPEKYYSQTHKLCNALEKLLLVTTPNTAFGGIVGGRTSQSQREERESVALADERGREEIEQRQRQLKRQMSSSSSVGEDSVLHANDNVDMTSVKGHLNTGGNGITANSEIANSASSGSTSSPITTGKAAESNQNDLSIGHEHLRFSPLISAPRTSPNSAMPNLMKSDELPVPVFGSECDIHDAAWVSLRERFVSMPVDRNASTEYGSAESCSATRSPPPPDLGRAIAPTLHNPHILHVSEEMRRHLYEAPTLLESGDFWLTETHPLHPGLARPLSPIIFSDSRPSGPILSSSVDERVRDEHTVCALHSSSDSMASTPRGDPKAEIVVDSSSIYGPSAATTESSSDADADVLDIDVGASASDVDFEFGDDVSLDDSASDRSDGSDSNSGASFYEPLPHRASWL